MELKPGTPEYQEAYDKEIKRLEAAAGKKDAKADDKADTTTSADDKAQAGKSDDAKTETADEIQARLAKVEKALKDTQRWGHENAAEVKRLKKEADERKRREDLAEDPVLKANPGLEETIKRVATPAKTEKAPQEAWLETVARAVPDVEKLLGDPAFHAKAVEKKAELGTDWDDPIIAIRELSSIRTEHLNQKSVTAAVEAARLDFEKKHKKRTAMDVPGGSGGKDAASPQTDEAVKRYSTMSKADFDKERSRVMGY